MGEKLLRTCLPVVLGPFLFFFRPVYRFVSNLHITSTLLTRWLQFKARPTDLFLCSYPKSGTTWIQMILYQMCTDGDMEKLDHLSMAIPHFELAPVLTEPLPGRRIYKTHLSFFWVPKGGKMIYVARNGIDVAHSYYHQMSSYRGFQGGFEAFFTYFLSGRLPYGSWFKHMASWAKAADRPDVLFLHYEDMIADLERAVRQIAAFCEIPLDEARLPSILERCSFAFMKAHKDKLDLRTLEHHYCDAKLGAHLSFSFIREGKVGEGRKGLKPPQAAQFQALYRSYVSGRALDRGLGDGVATSEEL